MGLWSWIINKLNEEDSTPPGRDGEPAVGFASAKDAAVAVADSTDAPGRADEGEPEEEDKWWAPADATLTEPPEVERPDLSTEARAIENLLISHFDGHDLSMPPLLPVAETVLPRLSNPRCELPAVANTLSEDQVIAAALLRMANSPLYRGLTKITALRPAITRLGVRALRTLLMHESLRAAMFHRKGGDRELAKAVWRRSLASGCIMRGLSGFTDIDVEDAFLIGLLHDIGDVIVLRVLCGEQVGQRYEIDLNAFEYLCYECHQEFGELIADAWSLPPHLKAIISNHHTYPQPDDPLRTARLQLQITDMINALLVYAPYHPYNLLESRAVCDLGLADRDDFMAFLKHLPDEVDETVVAL